MTEDEDTGVADIHSELADALGMHWYLTLEEGADKEEARRLVALELCRLDGGVVCNEWADFAPKLEEYLRSGSTMRFGTRSLGIAT